jgi:hypothetical protein
MLLRFTVSNYLSFNDKVTFSMIPSLQKTNSDNFISLEDIDVLRFGVLYGANASGKSNFIKAFQFLRKSINFGLSNRSVDAFCRISEKNILKESTFEYTFYSQGSFYSYGFSAILSQKRIVEEWLLKINPQTNNEKVIFNRTDVNQKAEEVFAFPLSNDDSARINTYLLDMKDKKNLLFLGQLRDKNFQDSDKLNFLSGIFEWLKNLTITFADKPIDNLESIQECNCEKISRILAMFDTGISKIFYTNISFDELQKQVKNTSLIQYIKDLFTEEKMQDPEGVHVMLRGNDMFYRIVGKTIDSVTISVIRLNHHNSPFEFDFREESDGTRRLFDLLDILLTDKKNAVFLLDEIERSLHPVLIYKFFEMVKKEFVGKNIQIIFTTHETHILDQQLFRRDEVWLVEKEETGASQLYSLDIFKERKDKNLSKNYLEGRYGGIPLFDKMGD